MQKGMIRENTFSIEEIFNLLQNSMKNNTPYIIVDGEEVHSDSQRYQVFMNYGCTCSKCGLKASYFALERYKEQPRYHLNLYGMKNGREILFTKDHIIPKAKGGKNTMDNYQTMCAVCNREKADN